MAEVTTTIEIDAPPQVVFDIALDAQRLHEWVTIHRELISSDDGVPEKGMEMEQKLVLRGAPFKVKWTLAKCESPLHAEWHGKGPARSKAETEYTLSELPGGRTRFDYRNDFKAPLGPLGKVAGNALVGGVPEKEAIASLKALKKLAEAAHRK